MKIKQAFFTICISITHFFCVGNNNPPVIENIITIPDSINTGGSVLIIGSAAGVAVMGILKIDFIWYLKNISMLSLIGYISGDITYIIMQ